MSKKGECVKVLQSPRMQPLWDEIDRIEKSIHADMRKDRDGNLTHALDALDRIRDIPRALESAAKGEAEKK